MAIRSDTVVGTSHGDIALHDTGGAGAPVVFLHGNSLCKEVFKPQIAALGSQCRAITVDLPGHGASSDAIDPSRTYSLGGYAHCVGEVLAAMGITDAAVVGWSLGGHIGLELTDSFAGLLGLMAITTPPFERLDDGTVAGFQPHPKLGMSGQREFSADEAREFASLISDHDSPAADPWENAVVRTDGRARSTLFESLAAMPPRRQRELAEQCPVPIAMIVGSDEQFADPDYIVSVDYRTLWSGEVQLFEGCGHAPQIHAADQFNDILKRFLTDVGVVRP